MNSLKLQMNELGVDSVMMNNLGVKMDSLKLKMNDLGADSVMKAIDDNIPDVLPLFQNIFGFFVNRKDDVFPLGTTMGASKHWILYGILGLVLLLCLPCLLRLVMGIVMFFFNILKGIFMFFFNIFKGIFMFFFNIFKGIWMFFFNIYRGIWRCLRRILCCCCKGGRKTMKAPGRNARIYRETFEANPADYFRGLRGKQPISGYYLV